MSHPVVKMLLTFFLPTVLVTATDAAPGDVNITVDYKVRAVRIRPQPNSGVAEATLRAVLHADGKVDDVLEGKADGKSKTWELKRRKLGDGKGGGAQWRVLDANTLLRKFGDRSFDYTVKIVVDGKTCSAEVSYDLHPGQKEFVAHSVYLNQIAYYSELKAFDARCRIE